MTSKHDMAEALEAQRNTNADLMALFAAINGKDISAEILEALGVDPDNAEESAHDALSDYGLSLEVETTTRVRMVFCTGGPHHEIQWDHGNPSGVEWVSLPWFDRIELGAAGIGCERFAEWLDEIVTVPESE